MKFIKKEWSEASYRKLHLQKGLGIMGMVLASFSQKISMRKTPRQLKVW